MIYIKDMDMPVDCLACRIGCKNESYRVTGRPGDCPLEEAKTGDTISRADAIEAVAKQWLFEASAESPYVNDDDIGEYRKLAEELFEDVPSAEAVQGYTEWLEKIIVDAETFEWLCEDTNDKEWCGENCHYSSIQAECLRHLYEASKGGDSV